MDKKGLAKSFEPFFEKVEKLSKVQRILIGSERIRKETYDSQTKRC